MVAYPDSSRLFVWESRRLLSQEVSSADNSRHYGYYIDGDIAKLPGGGRRGAAHSPFISDGGRRKAAQKGAQSSWDRRATKGASAPVSPSSAPVCVSIVGPSVCFHPGW